jgi:hypothetical protein
MQKVQVVKDTKQKGGEDDFCSPLRKKNDIQGKIGAIKKIQHLNRKHEFSLKNSSLFLRLASLLNPSKTRRIS